jgi:hypothetical protein
MGDLLAGRQGRNTGAFRLPSNDFRKERAQLGGEQAAGERFLVAIVVDAKDRHPEMSTGRDADPNEHIAIAGEISSQCETVPEQASVVSASIQGSGAQSSMPSPQSAGESKCSPLLFMNREGAVMMPSVSAYTWSRAATRHGPPALADTASSSAVCKASWSASQSSIAQEYL